MTQSMPTPAIEAVEAVVLKVTGRQPTDVHSLRHHEDYWIIGVAAPSVGPLIIKLTSSVEVPSFESAKAKHDLIRRAAQVPMAEMIAADDSASDIPFRFSLQTRLQGEEWFTRRKRLDEAEFAEAIANLGEVIGRLHLPPLPGFGPLPEPPPGNCLPALIQHSRTIIRNFRLKQRFTDLLEKNADLWSVAIPPAITHDDLHGFNVLFDPARSTKVSGLLDFDKAWSGPAESDIARMEMWYGMTGPSFLATYRERIPKLPGYEERRPFYQMLWCLEYAQETTEHLQITNALCRRLDLPPLQSFN